MEQLKNFHDLYIDESPPKVLQIKQDSRASENSNDTELESALSAIEEVKAESAAEEAMLQSSPRYCERGNITGLVRKYQNDVKQELASPSKLKEKHGSDKDKLVKEHKIQVTVGRFVECLAVYSSFP